MAFYTIKLGDMLRNMVLNNQYSTVEDLVKLEKKLNQLYSNPIQVVSSSRTLFFNFTYPLYDATHKEELERKILYYYYDYEINAETPAMFQFNVNRRLNEIMPYFNKVYQAMAKNYDFDENINYTELISKEGENSSTQNNTNTITSTDSDSASNTYNDRLRKSDTPQGELEDVENGDYISEYNYNNGTETKSNTNTLNSTNALEGENSGDYKDTSTRIIKGTDSKDRSILLANYYKAIKNVDLEVINGLKSCFMLLWE